MRTTDKTPRRRLLDILAGRDAGSRAVLCPGGMMSMAVTEVMDACGARWPEAHSDAAAMATLALAMQEDTGFDSVAMPFCMTIEAESYGATVDLGTATSQPRVRGALLSPAEDGRLPEPDFTSGRAKALLDALAAARVARPDVAVIGNIPGPFSALGMLTDPLAMMKWTRKSPDRLRRYLDAVTEDLGLFARLQVSAGADVICVAEPTATGEILGGKLFREFALAPLRRLTGEIRSSGASAIVHICGDVSAIEEELFEIDAEAVSFDSMVDIVALGRRNPSWLAMGNVSAFQLLNGPAAAIRRTCERLIAGGVRLVAPACGVIPTTPVAHLTAMREAVDGTETANDRTAETERDR